MTWQMKKIRVCTPQDQAELNAALTAGWEPYAVAVLDNFCATHFLKRSNS